MLYGEKAGNKKKNAEVLGIEIISREEFVLKYPESSVLIEREEIKYNVVQNGLF